jgi:serine/threonine-protein kinase
MPARALRLAIPLPPDHELVVGQLPALEMSRDVDVVVYRARQAGTMRLYARALDQAEPTPVPATEDAVGHAVSPDGRWVAFGRDGHLFKALLSGGPPVKLGAAPGGVSVGWDPDNTIVYSTASDRSLLRLPESGGAPVTLVTVDGARGEQSVSSPDVSADGTIGYTVAFRDRTAIAVTGPGGGAGQVLTEGRQPRFLAPDLLVFARQQSLWAARYDARRRALASEPVLVLDGVERSTLNSHVHYTVGAGGSLLYIPARGPKGQQALMWRDRRGGDLDVELQGKGFVRFALSPDSSRIALAVAEGDDRDIWILERARKALSRLTLDPSPESAPLWSPDGTKVAYRHDGDGGGIMLQAADGSRAPTQLTRGGGVVHIPYSFTPDGRQLLFVEFRDYRMQNVHVVSIDDPARVTPVLVGPGAKTRPAVSPDGRWLAYQSDESGRSEVYVRPWPDVERARWQVSTSGGTSPVWRRDGRELFFAAGDTIMAASVEVSRAFRTRLAEALFPLGKPPERLGALFDVSPDGMRFLVVRDPPAETGSAAPETRLVTNWERVLRPQLDAR